MHSRLCTPLEFIILNPHVVKVVSFWIDTRGKADEWCKFLCWWCTCASDIFTCSTKHTSENRTYSTACSRRCKIHTTDEADRSSWPIMESTRDIPILLRASLGIPLYRMTINIASWYTINNQSLDDGYEGPQHGNNCILFGKDYRDANGIHQHQDSRYKC